MQSLGDLPASPRQVTGEEAWMATLPPDFRRGNVRWPTRPVSTDETATDYQATVSR